SPTPPAYPLPLHDALPISAKDRAERARRISVDQHLACGRVHALDAQVADRGIMLFRIGDSFFDHAQIQSDWLGLAAEVIGNRVRSEEHTSELQSRGHLVCR